MKRMCATAMLIAAVGVGCDDSPVSPTTLAGVSPVPRVAPFRNFGDSVPSQATEACHDVIVTAPGFGFTPGVVVTTTCSPCCLAHRHAHCSRPAR
jgi:hypothetical protein